MKLWKCICRKSEFTDKGQVLIGNIYSSGEVYFKGASFHATKEGEWEVDGTITLTREDFEKCVQKFSEICEGVENETDGTGKKKCRLRQYECIRRTATES